MQEREKKKIVLASVLKPVDDTRMFEKIGCTLALAGHDVHIIGFPTEKPPQHDSIKFYPLTFFSRISFERFTAGYRVFKIWFTLKPQFVIISTHELLIFALLTKLLFKTKIIYDIRENYLYNILHTTAFPKIVRPFIGYWVRLKEILVAPFIHHFILAEKEYGTELTFLPERKTVLENKFRKSLIRDVNKSNNYTKLLFTGTLAETTGIFQVLNFVKRLHEADETISLTIIGYAAKKGTLEKILAEIKHVHFVKLIGGAHLVPHSQTIDDILKADFGIIWYPKNKSTKGSIPTKFYEYTALCLPILIPAEQTIANQVALQRCGVVFDTAKNVESILQEMRSFQLQCTVNPSLYWESEEYKLLEILKGQ